MRATHSGLCSLSLLARPPTHLRATDDLLGRLRLLTAYDAHVRPYVRPVGSGAADVEMTYVGPGAASSSAGAGMGGSSTGTAMPTANANTGSTIKGKGKGKQLDEPMAIATPSGEAAPPTDKKKKKDKHSDSYRGLIHNVPGQSCHPLTTQPQLHTPPARLTI